MKAKKIIGYVVLLAVLVGAGVGIWRWRASHAEPAVQYKTEPVERRDVVARVTASGTLQATVTVQVGAQVSGRIQKLAVDYNSTVKKGELIAKLDPQLFQAAVEQARANYLSAKANVDKANAQERDAEMNLARAKNLAAESLASASELQTAQTNLNVAKASTEVAKASLEQASAALHQAQVNLSYTDIYSPIDGTVISRSVDVGQTVASSLQAPVLFTIAEDLRKMQVHTSVAEGDVGRLQPGMPATFTVDAFPGERFKGVVGQIRNAAQTVQNVVTYDAVIDVDNSDLRLRPGMTATVTIVWSRRDDVLAVPNAALRFTPSPEVAASLGLPPPGRTAKTHTSSASAEGPPPAARRGRSDAGASAPAAKSAPPAASAAPAAEQRRLFLLEGGAPHQVSVTTGLTDGSFTEIVDGPVKAGDQAIVDATSAGSGGAGGGRAPRMGRMF